MREGGEGNRTNEENANLFDENVFRPRKTGASELQDFTSNTNNRELATSNPTESRSLLLAAQQILLGIGNRNTDNTYTNLSQQHHCSVELWWVNSPSLKLFSHNRNVLRVEKTQISLLSLSLSGTFGVASFLSPFSRNTAQDEFKVKYGK